MALDQDGYVDIGYCGDRRADDNATTTVLLNMQGSRTENTEKERMEMKGGRGWRKQTL